MRSSRLIVLVMVSGVGAFCSLHPSSRAWICDGLVEARLRMFGAGPDDLYRLAERQYTAGDFEKAELSCDRVLKYAPRHAPATALRMEVQFILGQGHPTSGGTEYDKYFICTYPIGHAHMLVEIDNCLTSGERWMQCGETTKAEKEFRKVLEFAKWMPTSIEIDQRCTRARSSLTILSSTR